MPDLVIPGRPEKPQAGQPEFVQTPADYIKESAIERLAAQGRKLYDQYRPALGAIERQFGVDPTVVLAIFGRETDYGRAKDTRSAIRVLATQAYLGKRKDKFRDEFLLALKMLQDGAIRLADMKSSWAGAMGLTQFLPSDYLKYAVDFDGDGRADIWNSVPDALASAAKQLADKGWQRGLHWAYEVHPPANVDCTIGVPENTLTDRRMAQARLCAGLWPYAVAGGARRDRVAGAAGEHLRTVLSRPDELFRASRNTISPISTCCSSAISATASLDPRPFETPWGKVALLADPRSRPHAGNPHRARLLSRQDRRQGRNEDARRGRRISEAQRAESRLLADARRCSRTCRRRRETDAALTRNGDASLSARKKTQSSPGTASGNRSSSSPE